MPVLTVRLFGVGKKTWKKSKLAVLCILEKGFDAARTNELLKQVAETGRVVRTA